MNLHIYKIAIAQGMTPEQAADIARQFTAWKGEQTTLIDLVAGEDGIFYGECSD
jgi:hypothetical protein